MRELDEHELELVSGGLPWEGGESPGPILMGSEPSFDLPPEVAHSVFRAIAKAEVFFIEYGLGGGPPRHAPPMRDVLRGLLPVGPLR